MAFARGPKISTGGLVFCFDGLNKKCYSGSGTSFNEVIRKTPGTATVGSTQSLSVINNHLEFISDGSTNSCYIEFPSDSITVPTGSTATWMWWQYFIDGGSLDHPNFGKETGSGWDGIDGFVFGTGWGTDGPRWGIGGTNYNIYGSIDVADRYKTNVWQCWVVTFDGLVTNGLKTYLNGVLINEGTPITTSIGSNTNNLFIGKTNSRGGNWNGYMDLIYMWDRTLTSDEVLNNYNSTKNRFI